MVVKVKLLLFAQAKDLAGKSEDSLTVPKSVSYAGLLELIVRQYSLEQIQNNILISVNEELCSQGDNLQLKDNDEIAVIPPLSGG